MTTRKGANEGNWNILVPSGKEIEEIPLVVRANPEQPKPLVETLKGL